MERQLALRRRVDRVHGRHRQEPGAALLVPRRRGAVLRRVAAAAPPGSIGLGPAWRCVRGAVVVPTGSPWPSGRDRRSLWLSSAQTVRQPVAYFGLAHPGLGARGRRGARPGAADAPGADPSCRRGRGTRSALAMVLCSAVRDGRVRTPFPRSPLPWSRFSARPYSSPRRPAPRRAGLQHAVSPGAPLCRRGSPTPGYLWHWPVLVLATRDLRRGDVRRGRCSDVPRVLAGGGPGRGPLLRARGGQPPPRRAAPATDPLPQGVAPAVAHRRWGARRDVPRGEPRPRGVHAREPARRPRSRRRRATRRQRGADGGEDRHHGGSERRDPGRRPGRTARAEHAGARRATTSLERLAPCYVGYGPTAVRPVRGVQGRSGHRGGADHRPHRGLARDRVVPRLPRGRRRSAAGPSTSSARAPARWSTSRSGSRARTSALRRLHDVARPPARPARGDRGARRRRHRAVDGLPRLHPACRRLGQHPVDRRRPCGEAGAERTFDRLRRVTPAHLRAGRRPVAERRRAARASRRTPGDVEACSFSTIPLLGPGRRPGRSRGGGRAAAVPAPRHDRRHLPRETLPGRLADGADHVPRRAPPDGRLQRHPVAEPRRSGLAAALR